MTKEQKLFIGHKVRRLRQLNRLTQAQMADDIGVSASYLNLIERNQRPVTATVLLKIAQSYDIDIKSFASDDEAETKMRFSEMFNDNLFGDIHLSQQDYRDLAALSPEACEAIEKLFHAYKDIKTFIKDGSTGNSVEEKSSDPIYETMQFFRSKHNYIEDIEKLAEQTRKEAKIEQDHLFSGLSKYLKSKHHIDVQVLPLEVMGDLVRRFDYHGRRLLLNEMLCPASRCYQAAVQLAFVAYRNNLENIIKKNGDFKEVTKKVLRLGLANYFAGAVLLPYKELLRAAKETRYNLDVLTSRFLVTQEQILHRLTTLRKSEDTGIPFFFIRIDKAGNISKQITMPGMDMHFPRENALCPRWDIQSAFEKSPAPAIKLIETPEGQHFVTVAHHIVKHSPGINTPAKSYVIAIGCPYEQAKQMIYSDYIDLDKEKATPIGPTCRLCWRQECSWRAVPPSTGGRLSVDEYRRDKLPYQIILSDD